VRFLNEARSVLALLLVMLYFAFPGTPVFYLVAWPLAQLQPAKRRFHVSWFMRMMSWGIHAIFEWVGGARFVRVGKIPTHEGGALIIMNHQSQLDITTATLMARPYTPAFVPRALYARWIPLVSPCIRLLDCPIVDPRKDPKGAAAAMVDAATRERYGLLVYPEGHRTLDGDLRPFRTAGLQAILQARRMPVYLVVTDGFWAGRRLVDFLDSVHRLRGRTEVLGPFEPPPPEPEAIERAIAGWRAAMTDHLAKMRASASSHA